MTHEARKKTFDLAISLLKNKQSTQALSILEKLYSLNPSDADVLSVLGAVYAQQRRFVESRSMLETLKRSGRAKQADLLNLADVYVELKELKLAASIFQQVINVDKSQIRANLGIGRIFFATENYDLALNFLKVAYEQKPDEPLLAGNIFEVKRRLLIWNDFDAMQSKLWIDVLDGKVTAHPWSLFSTFDHPEFHLVAHTNLLNALGISKIRRQHYQLSPKSESDSGRIKVGYFSPDFRTHAVTSLMLEALECHSRDRFEIHAFYFPPLENDRSDEKTDAVVNAVEHFHQIGHLSDEDIVSLARENHIDIAVDLCGLTTGHRIGIFAKGVAPIQVSYLGYPGTLGGKVWDYIIADEQVIPSESRQHYAERIVYLDGCFQPNDSRRLVGQPLNRSDYGLPDGAFVLCCFNDIYKVTPQMTDIWLRMLQEFEDVVLWIKINSSIARANFLKIASVYEIDADRIIFAERVAKYEEHLARYSVADLFLDTFPYNGHTTASDVLWSGLPLISLRGKSNCSRVCSSILHHLGLNELIADCVEEYEIKIRQIIADRAYAQKIKSLVRNARESNLFSGKAAAANLEQAYERMVSYQSSGRDIPALIDCREIS